MKISYCTYNIGNMDRGFGLNEYDLHAFWDISTATVIQYVPNHTCTVPCMYCIIVWNIIVYNFQNMYIILYILLLSSWRVNSHCGQKIAIISNVKDLPVISNVTSAEPMDLTSVPSWMIQGTSTSSEAFHLMLCMMSLKECSSMLWRKY